MEKDDIDFENTIMLDPKIRKILQEHLNDFINTISSMPDNKNILEQDFFEHIKSNTEKAENCFECMFCKCKEINSEKELYKYTCINGKSVTLKIEDFPSTKDFGGCPIKNINDEDN